MLTTVTLVGVGFVAGLGIWWHSRDRRRGRALRHLALHYRLPVEAVQDAALRALQYGLLEDFTFLVRIAHPQPHNGEAPIRLSAWHPDLSTGDAVLPSIMSLPRLQRAVPKKGEV